jgi:hypothetical protein
MIFTCIALEIYDEKNFDLSHTFHRVKKMNMKDVHKLFVLEADLKSSLKFLSEKKIIQLFKSSCPYCV